MTRLIQPGPVAVVGPKTMDGILPPDKSSVGLFYIHDQLYMTHMVNELHAYMKRKNYSPLRKPRYAKKETN